MNRTDKFLGLAAEEAQCSDMYHKHGAVLVKGGHVVAKGHNSRRTRLHGANHWYPPISEKQLNDFFKNLLS